MHTRISNTIYAVTSAYSSLYYLNFTVYFGWIILGFEHRTVKKVKTILQILLFVDVFLAKKEIIIRNTHIHTLKQSLLLAEAF